MKHRPMAKRKRYSWVSAIFLVIVGMRYLLTRYNPPPRRIIFPNIMSPAINWFPSQFPLNVAKKTNKSMTMTSCTIRIPMDSLPKVLSVSSWSDKSLSTTMVELNANPIPIYAEVMASNHNMYDNQYPTAAVTSTCKHQATMEFFPRSLMMSGLSSIPTIKRSKLIPILEKVWIAMLSFMTFGKNMLRMIPATIYPIIIGCLKNFIIPIVTRTTPIIIHNEVNICSDIN